MPAEVWATTVDNPFDYWTQTDRWEQFDFSHQYYTEGRIAKYCGNIDNLTEFEQRLVIARAVSRLVNTDNDLYRVTVNNGKERGWQ